MKMKKVISLISLLSFLVTFLTSVILYLVPQGRVAYWASWKLWGLSKEEWAAIHTNVGFLFLAALLFHIYYNWKPMISYLKNRVRNFVLFTREFNVALVVTVLVTVGTYMEIPPFSTIIEIGESIKDEAAKEYGEPPYGHAELSSLKTFSKRVEINLEDGIRRIKNAGYTVENETQTLAEIALQNGVSPQQIYQAMVPEEIKTSELSEKTKKIPEKPVPGTGNISLADLCHQYNLNINVILRGLKELQIEADADMSLKKIGEIHKKNPNDIYDMIRSLVTSSDNTEKTTEEKK